MILPIEVADLFYGACAVTMALVQNRNCHSLAIANDMPSRGELLEIDTSQKWRRLLASSAWRCVSTYSGCPTAPQTGTIAYCG